MNGTIKVAFPERGFGFVTADDGTAYFFHRSALVRPLVLDRLIVGQPVRFTLGPGLNGAQAVRVPATSPPR